MIVRAAIVAESDDELFIKVPKPYRAVNNYVLVELDGDEEITAAQRRKAYVLLNAIAVWSGYTPMEATKEMMKFYYTSWTGKIAQFFSLSDCSKATAMDFITFLIDFCLSNNVPCDEPLQSLCEDIKPYIYACLMNKRCACCGKEAILHHVDRIGRGYNRRTKYQIGNRVLPLCAAHHDEIHTFRGDDMAFCEKYHIEPMELTPEIGKVYRLTNKALGKD